MNGPYYYFQSVTLTIVLLSVLWMEGMVHAAELRGRVVGESQTPLPGANVYLKGTVLGGASNNRGYFVIRKVPAGDYTLSVTMIGYQQEDIPVSISESRIYEVGIIRLVPSALAGQPIVVTASKYEQQVRNVPVSLATLSRKELQDRNPITIDRALEYVPGVNMNASQVNIRGSSGYSRGVGSRVLFLLDGIPFLTGDTREINFETVPVYVVDRVEVMKGAGSALYGSSALGGVVNIITRDIETGTHAYMRAYGGFYSEPSYSRWNWSDTRRYLNGAAFSVSGKKDKVGILLGGSRDEDDSYRQNDWRKRWSGSGKLQWEISPFQQLTVSGNYMWQKRGNFLYWKDLNHALQPPVSQLDDMVESNRYYVTTHYRYILNKNRYITVRGIWFRNRFEDNLTGEGGNQSTSGYLNGEIQLSWQVGRLFFTSGIEGHLNYAESGIFGNRSGHGQAAYLQGEITLSHRWKATVGARFDNFKLDSVASRSRLNPKLGLVFNPAAKTALRASAGLGFRAPSMAEIFISTTTSGLQLVPNLKLKPEKSRYAELGWNQTYTSWLASDAALFYSHFSDLIEGTFREANKIQFRNITQARVMGAEVSLAVHPIPRNLAFRLGYTYVDPRDLDHHRYLNFRPRHLFYSHLDFRVFFFRLGGDYRYISRYDQIDERLAFIVNNADERVPVHVVDLRIASDLNKRGFPFRFTFEIENLFQYNYVDLVGSLAPLRTFRLIVETGF